MYKEKRKTYKISIYIGSTFKDNLTVKRNIKTCYDWLFLIFTNTRKFDFPQRFLDKDLDKDK